jgi:hypothetical protein
MIAPINPEPEGPHESSSAGGGQGPGPGGGQGVILADPHHSRSDMRTLRRAIREGWKIGRQKKSRFVDRLAELAENADPYVALGAIRTAVSADSVDVKVLALSLPRELATVNVGVNIVNTSIESLLSAPAYVEFLESRDDCDSGTVRPDGDAGEVLPAPSHPGNLNGNSGHHYGEN